MTIAQPSLFDAPRPNLPEGLVYQPHFIDRDEEASLVARLETLPFVPFQFHGYEGKRRVVSFGWRYDFNEGGLQRAAPIPGWLQSLAARAAAFAGVAPDSFAHALLIEYAPGARIGWHRDRPQFEDVVGVSFLSPCRFRFRRRRNGRWERFALVAEPRSAYLLRGPSRHEWEHSIPPMETLRYSITLRTFRGDLNLPGTE